MAKWYEQSEVRGTRSRVEENLMGFPPSNDKKETATTFWARVERAGRLIEAMDLYEKFEKQRAEWVHIPRETKKAFAERVEREGRQAEVECARIELSKLGYSQREIQKQLVNRFQPLDGSYTRPWETPNPWDAGRLFRKKEDQDRVVPEMDEWTERKWRLDCAKWRREERVALANARRRAQELKALAAAQAKKSAEAKEGHSKVKKNKKSASAEEEPKIKGKWTVVKDPSSGSYENQWVPDAKS